MAINISTLFHVYQYILKYIDKILQDSYVSCFSIFPLYLISLSHTDIIHFNSLLYSSCPRNNTGWRTAFAVNMSNTNFPRTLIAYLDKISRVQPKSIFRSWSFFFALLWIKVKSKFFTNKFFLKFSIRIATFFWTIRIICSKNMIHTKRRQ